MKKENKAGNRAKGIATIIMTIGIIAGISWYVGCWYALFLVIAGLVIWWMCFSKVYAVVTKKKLPAENSGCVGFIVALVCLVIKAFTNETVALVILALPVVILEFHTLYRQ